ETAPFLRVLAPDFLGRVASLALRAAKPSTRLRTRRKRASSLPTCTLLSFHPAFCSGSISLLAACCLRPRSHAHPQQHSHFRLVRHPQPRNGGDRPPDSRFA